VLGYSALKTGLDWLATSLTALGLAGPAQILVTRAPTKLVLAAGMTLLGAATLWAAQVPEHGRFWPKLAGPSFLAGGDVFAFTTVSIGALAGVTDHDAGIASGLLNTSLQPHELVPGQRAAERREPGDPLLLAFVISRPLGLAHGNFQQSPPRAAPVRPSASMPER
jgi:hypothetical protein